MRNPTFQTCTGKNPIRCWAPKQQVGHKPPKGLGQRLCPRKRRVPWPWARRKEFSDGDRKVGSEGMVSKVKYVNLISPAAPATCRKNTISIAAVPSRPKRSCSRFRKHVKTPSLPWALAFCRNSLRLARKATHLDMTSTTTCSRMGEVVGSESPSSNTRGCMPSCRTSQALISKKMRQLQFAASVLRSEKPATQASWRGRSRTRWRASSPRGKCLVTISRHW